MDQNHGNDEQAEGTFSEANEALQQEPPSTISVKRTESDQAEWDQIRSVITRDLGVTASGNLTGDLAWWASNIGSGFIRPAASAGFSMLHVEPLIDQAADLLDRAIRDRASWDELAVKLFQLSIELNEFAELDAIHAEEEADGIYEVAKKVSKSDYDAETFYTTAHEYHKNLTDSLISTFYSDPRVNEQVNAARAVVAPSGAGPMDGAGSQASFQMTLGKAFANISRTTHANLQESSKKRFEGLYAKALWDSRNVTHLKNRTLVARKYQDLKAKAASNADGVLNYTRRLMPLKDRYVNDLGYAYTRLISVHQGLEKVYGYSVALPQDQQSTRFLDDCIIWTREAIQWLIQFSRRDQSAVVSVPLRFLLSAQLWEEVRAGNIVSFDLDESWFESMSHIRLRGVSAFIELGPNYNERGIWQIDLNVPAVGKCRHLSGQVVDLDQSIIPACRLGRVDSRQAVRDPDICGANNLFNCSPVGTGWSVKVRSSVPSHLDRTFLSDIVLDLHVVYRNVSP